MNDFAFDRKAAFVGPEGALQVAVLDAEGMIWAHSNPAELYRWITLRNNLLNTIAVAFPRNPSPQGRLTPRENRRSGESSRKSPSA